MKKVVRRVVGKKILVEEWPEEVFTSQKITDFEIIHTKTQKWSECLKQFY